MKEVADGDVNENNKRSRGLSQEDDEEDDEDDDVPGNKQFSVDVLLTFPCNDYLHFQQKQINRKIATAIEETITDTVQWNSVKTLHFF